MTVSFKLKMGMTLYHAQTMKELKIDNVVEQCYHEESQEYKDLCEEYKEIIGFDRESDKDKFDKELMKKLARDALKVQKETIESIENVVRDCFYQGTTAYISFGGYMINPKEFCAIRVEEFGVQISKK